MLDGNKSKIKIVINAGRGTVPRRWGAEGRVPSGFGENPSEEGKSGGLKVMKETSEPGSRSIKSCTREPTQSIDLGNVGIKGRGVNRK